MRADKVSSPRVPERLASPLLVWAAVLLSVLLVAVTYQPVWHADFIWDDDAHLTANPCIVGPLGFKEIWTTSAATYYPLVLTSFWVQHAFWGLNPLPYHLVNVFLHACCGLLLWQALRKLKVRGAELGAGLWVLHPVQVESVAWVTELKNTQSCFFYLLGVIFFLKWLEARATKGAARNYGLALLFASLAILSKSSTVMLPVALGLCWWWTEREWRWRNLRQLAPFGLISAAASGWTIWEQKFHSGAVGEDWTLTWPQRLVLAGKDLWFYLGKLACPHPLTFIYPRWEIDASRLLAWLPSVAALAALAWLWRKRNTRLRPIFFAFAYFAASIFPVLGFFDVYFFLYSFVGDHFQYLADMGPLALVGASILRAGDFFGRKAAFLARASSVALLCALGMASWQQAMIYHDEETLWNDTLAKNPHCWMAYNNLGVVRKEQGRLDEAVWHFNESLRLKPDYAMAQDNLGNVLAIAGRLEEAIPHYLAVLRLNPDNAHAHNNLGSALRLQGRISQAVVQYREALQLDPDMVDALKNLAWIRAAYDDPALRDGNEAVKLASRSVELTAGKDPWTLDALAAALAETGHFRNAAETCRKARELALASGQSELVHQLDDHRDLYRLELPCRISQ